MTKLEHRNVAGACAFFAHAKLRLALVLFTLGAFVFSGYLIQTHIHGAAKIAAADGLPNQSKAPADADHCLLCQKAIVAGHFIAPAPPAVPAVFFAIVAAPLLTALVVFVVARSHAWRGRAPPSQD